MDLMIRNKIEEDLSKDNSFNDKLNVILKLLMFWRRSQRLQNIDRRHGYEKGYAMGFEQGVYWNAPYSKMKQLSNNAETKTENEFLDKFYSLCNEYNLGITYHPQKGMIFFELSTIKQFNS